MDRVAPDVVAPQDVVTPTDQPRADVVAPPDIVAPPDVPAVRDVPASDGGVAAPGFYEYTAVNPGTLVSPAAAAWHPGGQWALILAANDGVFRFDAATRAITRVASTTTTNAWTHVSFTPDGSRALLLGTSGSGTSRTGRLYAWDTATSTLSERTADAPGAGGRYESIAWSPDRTRGVILASYLSSGAAFVRAWWLDAAGNRNPTQVFAHGLVANTGCEDIDFATNGFGDPTLALVCGTNTAAIYTVAPLDVGTRVTQENLGGIGNVSRIATHPQGALSLAVNSSSYRLYRLRQGQWTASGLSPALTGAFDVAFSDDGRRALAFGGFGRVWEFRTDLYAATEIGDVSMTGLNGPPYNQPSGAFLRGLAWRPGCDAGLVVGGQNSINGTSAFVAYFRATNGRACPN